MRRAGTAAAPARKEPMIDNSDNIVIEQTTRLIKNAEALSLHCQRPSVQQLLLVNIVNAHTEVVKAYTLQRQKTRSDPSMVWIGLAAIGWAGFLWEIFT